MTHAMCSWCHNPSPTKPSSHEPRQERVPCINQESACMRSHRRSRMPWRSCPRQQPDLWAPRTSSSHTWQRAHPGSQQPSGNRGARRPAALGLNLPGGPWSLRRIWLGWFVDDGSNPLGASDDWAAWPYQVCQSSIAEEGLRRDRLSTSFYRMDDVRLIIPSNRWASDNADPEAARGPHSASPCPVRRASLQQVRLSPSLMHIKWLHPASETSIHTFSVDDQSSNWDKFKKLTFDLSTTTIEVTLLDQSTTRCLGLYILTSWAGQSSMKESALIPSDFSAIQHDKDIISGLTRTWSSWRASTHMDAMKILPMYIDVGIYT